MEVDNNRAETVSSHDAGADNTVLVIGSSDYFPSVADLKLVTEPVVPFGMVALVGNVPFPQALRDLGSHDALLTPVADFCGRSHPRITFSASKFDAKSLKEAHAATAAARQKLATLPKLRRNKDLAALTALTLAWLYDVSIDAWLTPERAELITWPLIDGLSHPRELLESLTRAGLLEHRFFERQNICPKCHSARLMAREVCGHCGSANIEESDLVHHYSCGEQAQRARFVQDSRLVCPKCNKELRHYGVDYDLPGTVSVCQSCHESEDEPGVAFLCSDCGTDSKASDSEQRDCYNYALTETGVMAVEEGQLPGFGLETLLDSLPGWRSARDLALVMQLYRRVSNRYDRPFSVLGINPDFSGSDFNRLGKTVTAKAHRLIVDLIRETARDTDSLALFDGEIILFLPETPNDNCTRLEERLNTAINEVIGEDTLLRVRQIPDDQIEALVLAMSKA